MTAASTNPHARTRVRAAPVQRPSALLPELCCCPVVLESRHCGSLPLLQRLLRGELMRAWVSHPYRQVCQQRRNSRCHAPQRSHLMKQRSRANGRLHVPAPQVREEVGSLLAMAMDACTPSPSQSAHFGDAIRAEVAAFVQHLVGACQVPTALSAMPETVSAGTSTGEGGSNGVNELALEPTDEKERAKARAARETALRCISHTCNAARAFCVSEHAATLLPVVMTAAASVQPPDLSNAAKACAALVAHLPLLPSQYAGLLQLMQTLVTASSWRLRGGLLPVSALLAYRGQFTEPVEEHATAFRQMLHTLMCDTQLEVREASAVVLAGFIRLRGPSERKITLKWARQRAKRGQPAAARHAGVLALVALLQLAPYDVPAWLPEVCLQPDIALATRAHSFNGGAHSLNGGVAWLSCLCSQVIELLASFHAEPQPIKATVSQAFADFKRTHQDNWASHRERFTPEQQDLISDMLVSPSFYAVRASTLPASALCLAHHAAVLHVTLYRAPLPWLVHANSCVHGCVTGSNWQADAQSVGKQSKPLVAKCEPWLAAMLTGQGHQPAA